MKNKNYKNQMVYAALGGLLFINLFSGTANAGNGAVAALTGYDANETDFFKKNNITVGGWLNAGITYNSTSPDNNFNGPVTFGDRSGEFQLNQLNFFIQRAVATEGDKWDFGGRFDAMFGTDAIFTQAYGVPAYDINNLQPLSRNNWDLHILDTANNRFYGIALPQAYLEAYVPVGKGLNVKAGHFYTPIGYETVPAPDNFFYSHAYTMQYGEPFTHTGFLGNYAFDKNWSVMGGVTTASATGGWDGGWNKQLGNWGGIGGVTWTSSNKATSANIAGTYAGTSETSSQPFGMYSIVLKHNFNDKTHLILQHDHGFANGVVTANAVLTGAGVEDAQWYGINTHFYYDVKDNLSVGVRGEWFRDQNGFRVCTPARIAAALNGAGISYAGNISNVTCTPSSFYEFTAGVNWKPTKWLNLRPNIRYDWADGTANGGQYSPFGNGRQSQFLFSNDFTITF
jgi:hypothetical protein